MLKKVAFVYNSVPAAERQGVFAECATQKTVTAIEQALIQGGNEIIPVNLCSPSQLEHIFRERGKPDFAFVIAEGFLDQPATLYDGSGAALVRETLARLGVPSSHSPAAAMELCRHKERTYQTLEAAAVRIPWFVSLPAGDCSGAGLVEARFPLFVKPAGGGNSVGIDEASVVHTPAELAARVKYLKTQWGSINLVAEAYLPGPEYTVGVIGNGNPVVLPALAFPLNAVRSTEVKKMESRNQVPVEIVEPENPIYLPLRDLALRTFTALGCADAIRVDIKTSADGTPCVMDVNGTPSLGPAASLTRMAAAVGLEYPEFINLLLSYGLVRSGLAGPLQDLVAAAEEKLNILRRLQQVVA